MPSAGTVLRAMETSLGHLPMHGLGLTRGIGFAMFMSSVIYLFFSGKISKIFQPFFFPQLSVNPIQIWENYHLAKTGSCQKNGYRGMELTTLRLTT